MHSSSELPAGTQPAAPATGSDVVPASVSFQSAHHTTLAPELASPTLRTTDVAARRTMGSATFVAPSTQGAPDSTRIGIYDEDPSQPREAGATTTSYPAPASIQDLQDLLQLRFDERGCRMHDEADEPPRFKAAAHSPVAAALKKEFGVRRSRGASAESERLGAQLRAESVQHGSATGDRLEDHSEVLERGQLAREEEDARMALLESEEAEVDEVTAALDPNPRATGQHVRDLPASRPGEGWGAPISDSRDFSSLTAASCPNSYDGQGAPEQASEQPGAASH